MHTAANDVPAAFTLLRLEGPGLAVPSVGPDQLPPDWRERLAVTRAIGAAWRAGGKSLLLRVPSAVVPATMNCLFNPVHPDAAKFRVVAAMDWPFDRRLKG